MQRRVEVIAALVLVFSTLAGAQSGIRKDNEKKSSIAELVSRVINENGVEAAIEAYDVAQRTELKKYNFAEVELNKLGYQLLGAKRAEEAVAVFRLNVRAYPRSVNVYDSLAESLMRAGNTEESIKSYEKALALLDDSAMDASLKQQMRNNAEARLRKLRDPIPYQRAADLEDFISRDSEYPFGKINPKAPPETEQFGQLAGIWEATNFAFVGGKWFSGWPATWAWRYTLDGFAVQDLWIQREENLAPPLAHLNRDALGTNFRIFDPKTQKWQIAWFANATNIKTNIEAVFKDSEIIMHVEPVQGAPLRRITFHDISRDSFSWKSEASDDDGKSWELKFKIEAKRIR